MSDAQVSAQSRSQYVDFWNNILVPKFVRWRHILVGGLTLHSERIFPSLQVNKGDRVVDAGCGFGDTAIELARLVGPTGSVLAVDCCDGFLEYGRRDARAAGLSNVTFLEADVQSYPFEPVHDFCFSRFGTQFFENPVAGLRNMRTSLKPGGIMTMVVWRGIKDNPWLGHAKDIVLKFLPPPGENAQTCGPGPFSMADTDVVSKQLEIAGYKDIEFEQIDAQVFVGNDLDDAVAFQLAIVSYLRCGCSPFIGAPHGNRPRRSLGGRADNLFRWLPLRRQEEVPRVLHSIARGLCIAVRLARKDYFFDCDIMKAVSRGSDFAKMPPAFLRTGVVRPAKLLTIGK